MSLAILEHNFDIKDILSFRHETKALKSLNKIEKPCSSKKKSLKKEENGIVTFDEITISNPIVTTENQGTTTPIKVNGPEGTFFEISFDPPFTPLGSSSSQEGFSEIINKKVTEAFSNLLKENSSENTKYIVKKSYNHIKGHDEFLKECDTEEEANQFVKKLEKTFPELQKTCKFLVVKEEKEERN